MAGKKKEEFPILDVDDLDPNFKYEIAEQPGGENIRFCFQCGTCVADCPVRAINEKYNSRRIIRMVLIGMREEVLKSDFIWLCSTCYTCYERCPEDVRITDLMTAIKNIAVKEGYIHPTFKEQATLLREHGRLLEIGEFENEKRSKLGLPSIEENAEEIQKIFDEMKLDKIIKGGA